MSSKESPDGVDRVANLDSRRGYAFKEFEWLGEQHPEYEAARRAFSSAVYDPAHSVLTVKFREIIVACVLAQRHYPTLESHMRRAMREGATLQELIEAFEAAAVPGGFPLLHYALPFLMNIDADIKAGKPI